MIKSKKTSKIFNSNYFITIRQKLERLNYPYGLNFKNYFFIKYILSLLFFVLSYYRTSNILVSFIYFIIIYFIPNLLLNKFQKDESIKLIKEIKNLTSSLTLLLTSNITFYDALKQSVSSIEYKRLKEKFKIFVDDYSLYNFNIEPAIEKFRKSFVSEEFEMFNNIIYQGYKEGKILEMLEVFHSTLELSYYKYNKQRERKMALYIFLSAMFSLLNLMVISVYPMIVQIMDNITVIFR